MTTKSEVMDMLMGSSAKLRRSPKNEEKHSNEGNGHGRPPHHGGGCEHGHPPHHGEGCGQGRPPHHGEGCGHGRPPHHGGGCEHGRPPHHGEGCGQGRHGEDKCDKKKDLFEQLGDKKCCHGGESEDKKCCHGGEGEDKKCCHGDEDEDCCHEKGNKECCHGENGGHPHHMKHMGMHPHHPPMGMPPHGRMGMHPHHPPMGMPPYEQMGRPMHKMPPHGKPHPFGKFRLLSKLQEEDLTMTDLATKLDMRMPSVSEMVNKLESKGLVEKLAQEEDKRKVVVRITEKGKEDFEKHKEEKAKFEDDFFSPLTDEEVEQLGSLLEKLFANK